jgi:germination protein M
VQKLIEGPDAVEEADPSAVTAAIPADTVLNSTTIRDNICYVDLSEEFTEMIPGVSSDVVIYSIVNTLCELSNVNKVQFLIDGEPQDKYGETLEFYLPFERNLDLVTGGIE